MWRTSRRATTVVGLLALVGCANLPGSGPTTRAPLDNATVVVGVADTEAFVLVNVTTPIAQELAADGGAGVGTSATLLDTQPPPFVIEEGDTVQVSLVNVSTEGFLDFTQSAISPISLTPLPPQTVSADGRINIPGLGRVPAEGLSPERLERALTDALSEVLVDPSVVVQVTDRQSARATVVGEVDDPGSKPILRRNLRLVELIGLAGGQTTAAEELVVSFVRGEREVRLPLTTVLTEPDANIRVHPGDLISVERRRRAYVIRGAVTLPGRYELIEPELTVEEAIGLARGILNRRASRNGVFLYRMLPKARLARLGADLAEFESEQVPTIFHFDYRVPTTIFAAQSFAMRNGDVVFVSDHLIEEISKIFGIFTTVVPVQSFIPAPVE